MNEQSTIEVEEKRERMARRVPPGDQWEALFNSSRDLVFDSLTDVLEYIYQEKGYTKFYMDAREGYVYSVRMEEREVKPEPPKKYSLYGDH